jgi:hypothetical protein
VQIFGLIIISRYVLTSKFSTIYSGSGHTAGTHQWSTFVNHISVIISVFLTQHRLVHRLGSFFPLFEIVLVIHGHISPTFVVSKAERIVLTTKIRVFIMNKLMWDAMRGSLVTNWKSLSHISILFFWLLSQNVHSTLSYITFSGNSSWHIFFGSLTNRLHILVVWFNSMLSINSFIKV